ncbi:hypothetical protein O1M54_42650 [Streptomyces diastatochromogenes]|nr:hypothetical protein [Streptomyces diastatochromogenes]
MRGGQTAVRDGQIPIGGGQTALGEGRSPVAGRHNPVDDGQTAVGYGYSPVHDGQEGLFGEVGTGEFAYDPATGDDQAAVGEGHDLLGVAGGEQDGHTAVFGE